MSKPKLRLVPTSSGVCLVASYNLKNGKIAMLVNGRYVEASAYEETDKDGKVVKYKPDFISFNAAMPYIDLGERGGDVYKFWAGHPFVGFAHNKGNERGKDGYNPNLTGTPVAYIYDDELIAINRHDEFKKMLSVLNAVNAMSSDELVDLCYYMDIEVGSDRSREVLLGRYFCPDGLLVSRDAINKIAGYIYAIESGNAVRERAIILFNKAYEAGLFTQDRNNYLYYEGKALGEKADVLMKIMTSDEFRERLSAAVGGSSGGDGVISADTGASGRRKGVKKKAVKEEVESIDEAADGEELSI